MSAKKCNPNKELEIQMKEMSDYLEKLIEIDEPDCNNCADCINYTAALAEMNITAYTEEYIGIYTGEYTGEYTAEHTGLYGEYTGVSSFYNEFQPAQTIYYDPQQPVYSFGYNDYFYPSSTFNYGYVDTSSQYATNNLTSVLSNTSNLRNFTPSYKTSYQRSKKQTNYKKSFYTEPDTSGINIDATMMELGLTPESLTQNKVQQLFYLFSDLDFSIHAEYITSSVYDLKTIPNTLSVSAQTKHAVWSCHMLLRRLREVLKRPVPIEYTSAYYKCQEALSELYQAAVNLEYFKSCPLEHRRGDFIGPDAEVYLQPLMNTLYQLTKCVEKSRMHIQVYERALNAPELYKATLLPTSDSYLLSSTYENYTELPTSSRSQLFRRYIGSNY